MTGRCGLGLAKSQHAIRSIPAFRCHRLRVIAICDDVLTTGAHYRGAQTDVDSLTISEQNLTISAQARSLHPPPPG
jgi:hypothetical protein